MRKIKVDLPEDDRVETGGVMFDEDWPGFFLRGDDALFVASMISALYSIAGQDWSELHTLKVLADQIFEEVPYKQWVDEKGHSIIEPIPPEETDDNFDDTTGLRTRVKRDGTVTQEDENAGEEDQHIDEG